MSYYDLNREERKAVKEKIFHSVKSGLEDKVYKNILAYSSDHDTYIRKNVYLAIGTLYRDSRELRKDILSLLKRLLGHRNEKVRQTVVYALGEIGKINFEDTRDIFESVFAHSHHSVLNAVTGALKQIGEKNPGPVLEFVRKHLRHPNPKIRVKLLHGLELRGRTHPEDILPVLAEYQNDTENEVVKTIIHVLGQISYKEGCLEKVVKSLKKWENTGLVERALKEIAQVHRNYEKFSYLSCEEAENFIKREFGTV